MPTLKTTLTAATLGLLLAAGLAPQARAGSLENLERERAILLQTLMDGDLSAEERQNKVDLSRRRLVDLERMVLRDQSLAGKNTPIVRSAFESYDLTFLVHASVEHNRGMMDHWLEQVGVSTKALMNARVGRR